MIKYHRGLWAFTLGLIRLDYVGGLNIHDIFGARLELQGVSIITYSGLDNANA